MGKEIYGSYNYKNVLAITGSRSLAMRKTMARMRSRYRKLSLSPAAL